MDSTESKEIYTAINGIMSEIGAIGKDRVNEQQHFNFRGIDDVMNAMKPLLSKYGVFVIPKVVDMKREERQTRNGGTLIFSILTVEHHYTAKDGSEIVSTTIGEGMDNGDKASNKAMAIALKYSLCQVFCIPTEDIDDPDASSIEAQNPERAMLLQQLDNIESEAHLKQLTNNFWAKFQGDKQVVDAFKKAKKGLGL